MALAGVKGGPGAGKGKGGKPVALDQRAAIYLNLAKVIWGFKGVTTLLQHQSIHFGFVRES